MRPPKLASQDTPFDMQEDKALPMRTIFQFFTDFLIDHKSYFNN
jgi:hypothetical protein